MILGGAMNTKAANVLGGHMRPELKINFHRFNAARLLQQHRKHKKDGWLAEAEIARLSAGIEKQKAIILGWTRTIPTKAADPLLTLPENGRQFRINEQDVKMIIMLNSGYTSVDIANVLHIQQPSASKRIRRISQELGGILAAKKARAHQNRLNKKGMAVADIFKEIDSLFQEARDIK